MHFRNHILQKHVTTHRSILSPAARSIQQRKMSFHSSKTNPYWKSFSITVKSIALQFTHAIGPIIRLYVTGALINARFHRHFATFLPRPGSSFMF